MERTFVGVAPGRVNLIGEHTDYNGGLCLPFALPLTTRATLRPRADRRVRLTSAQIAGTWEGDLDRLGPGLVTGWAGYGTGVLWALQQRGWELPGLDVMVDGDVPLGAGLSSSAALEAAVAVAATALTGRTLTPALRLKLVDACRRSESDVVGAPTGGLDQTAVLLCPEGQALLLDFSDGSRRPVRLPLREEGLAVLVIDTGVAHSNTDGGYAERRAECERGDPRRLRHVRSENDRVRRAVRAIEGRDWIDLGRLLSESHASLRDDFEVSCGELDLAVSTALATGALGARLTGGGFGGSAIALIEAVHAEAIGARVRAAFLGSGLTAPTLHLVSPAGPARIADPAQR